MCSDNRRSYNRGSTVWRTRSHDTYFDSVQAVFMTSYLYMLITIPGSSSFPLFTLQVTSNSFALNAAMILNDLPGNVHSAMLISASENSWKPMCLKKHICLRTPPPPPQPSVFSVSWPTLWHAVAMSVNIQQISMFMYSCTLESVGWCRLSPIKVLIRSDLDTQNDSIVPWLLLQSISLLGWCTEFPLWGGWGGGRYCAHKVAGGRGYCAHKVALIR